MQFVRLKTRERMLNGGLIAPPTLQYMMLAVPSTVQLIAPPTSSWSWSTMGTLLITCTVDCPTHLLLVLVYNGYTVDPLHS